MKLPAGKRRLARWSKNTSSGTKPGTATICQPVAAINRAQTAISEYQYAPATEEALSLMVKSYGALKMPELEADARRVLQKNFPNSALLAGSNSTKPWWKLW